MEVKETHPAPSSLKKSPSPAPRKPHPHSGNSAPSGRGGGGGGAIGEVSERLEMYKHGIQQAEAAGESSKVRRYKRSVATLEQVCCMVHCNEGSNEEQLHSDISYGPIVLYREVQLHYYDSFQGPNVERFHCTSELRIS